MNREFPADQLTPVTAYATLARKGSCLLETAQDHPDGSRNSFFGIEPIATFSARGQNIEVRIGSDSQTLVGDPYEELERLEKQLGIPAIGFVSYDAVRCKEKIPSRHSDTLNLPDFFFQFYQSMLVFDHAKELITMTAPTEAELDRLTETLLNERQRLPVLGNGKPIEVVSNLSDTQYCALVEEAKKHIVAGDIFQIVLSRTFQVKTDAGPFQIYRALRQKNPAPYLFFFEFENFAIAGASPEKIISVQDGRIESMPIAGTAKAGDSIENLLADPKETAEHVMLVDLARNDLGAVCLPGTVQVVEFKQPHKFSHVTHIVSRVQGRLDPRFTALDAFKASFPAGTLSGAPKVRAMELIDKLEISRRGLYGGAIVALDGKGNLRSCIAIRMALIKDGTAYIRAGGGIVLDSDPQKEAEETRMKASSVLDALKFAGGA